MRKSEEVEFQDLFKKFVASKETRALVEAISALSYIAYGDIIEGVSPDDPNKEAHISLKRIHEILWEENNPPDPGK